MEQNLFVAPHLSCMAKFVFDKDANNEILPAG